MKRRKARKPDHDERIHIHELLVELVGASVVFVVGSIVWPHLSGAAATLSTLFN